MLPLVQNTVSVGLRLSLTRPGPLPRLLPRVLPGVLPRVLPLLLCLLLLPASARPARGATTGLLHFTNANADTIGYAVAPDAESLYVRVEDPDREDGVRVTLCSGSEPAGEEIELPAAPGQVGVFHGGIPLRPEPGGSGDGILAARTGDILTALYRDNANDYGNEEEVRDVAALGGLSGSVSGRWMKSGGPYVVTGDLAVDGPDTLVIEPGVAVAFFPGCALVVRGVLRAIGAEQDTIAFGPVIAPGMAGALWPGLTFDPAEARASLLSYCLIERAEEGCLFRGGLGSRLEHSRIRRCWRLGVAAGGQDETDFGLTISSCVIEENAAAQEDGGGLQIARLGSAGDLWVENTVVTRNFQTGLDLESGAAATIRDCEFVSNHGWGIFVDDAVLPGGFSIRDSAIHGNTGSHDVYCDSGIGVFEVDLRGNDWGPAVTAEMNTGGNPKNISRIRDGFDAIGIPMVNYGNWIGGAGPFGNSATVTLADPQWQDLPGGYPADTDSIRVLLHEPDLSGSATVTVTSGHETGGEIVVLSAVAGAPGHFRGAIAVSLLSLQSYTAEELQAETGSVLARLQAERPGRSAESLAIEARLLAHRHLRDRGVIRAVPALRGSRRSGPGDGILDVASGDIIEVTYQDGLNEYGQPELVRDEAAFGGISGSVSGTWTLDGSPHLVTGDVTVDCGATLTIEPGAEIRFLPECRLEVLGRLSAPGDQEHPILLRHVRDTVDPLEPLWDGILFDPMSECPNQPASTLSHCAIEQAAIGCVISGSSTTTLSHCSIRDCGGYGVLVYQASRPVTIENCVIEECGWNDPDAGGLGISSVWTGNNLQVRGCRIEGNYETGVDLEFTAGGRIVDCVITGNHGWGIFVDEMAIPSELTFRSCLIEDNARDHDVYCDDGVPAFILDLRENDWGAQSTGEMNAGPNPRNLTRVRDRFDEPALPEINYGRWIGGVGPFGYTAEIVLADENWNPIQTRLPEESDTLRVMVFEPDGGSAPTGEARSDSDSSGTPLVFEVVPDQPGSYRATLPLDHLEQADGPPPGGRYRSGRNDDVALTVRSGDRINVSYLDPLDDYGNQRTVEDEAPLGGVAGPVSGTWSREEGPYVVTGDLLVLTGASLVIEAGTEVRFHPECGLTVRGSLSATGTAEEPILFAPHRDSGEETPWDGLVFDPRGDAGSSLSHVRIERARDGCLVYGTAPFSLTHSAIAQCSRRGVTVTDISSALSHEGTSWDSGDPVVLIESCEIVGNGSTAEGVAGLQIAQVRLGDLLSVRHTVISGNRPAGVDLGERAAGHLSGCAITDNLGWGILLSGAIEPHHLIVRECSIHGNGAEADVRCGKAGTFSVNLRSNDWGEITTQEILGSANPKNLSRIHDWWDDHALPRINYSEWIAPPQPFALVSPPDSALVGPVTTFRWRRAFDPGDTVDYIFHWSPDPLFSESESLAVGSDTMATLGEDDVLPSVWYTWRVRAVDGSGLSRWSEGGGWHFQNPALPALPSLLATPGPGGIEISWTSPAGPSSLFRVYRRDSGGDGNAPPDETALPVEAEAPGWMAISPDLRATDGFVTWLDAETEPGTLHVYAVRQTDPSGTWQWWGPVTAGLPAIRELSLKILPNPGGTPRVALALPRGGDVSVRLFNLAGREILREDWPGLRAGRHERTLEAPSELPAGTYWARVSTPSGTCTTRWMMLR